MKAIQLAICEKALRLAAEDAYQSEIVDTEMEKLIIGEDLDYSAKDDFIEQRMLYWIGKAKDEIRAMWDDKEADK